MKTCLKKSQYELPDVRSTTDDCHCMSACKPARLGMSLKPPHFYAAFCRESWPKHRCTSSIMERREGRKIMASCPKKKEDQREGGEECQTEKRRGDLVSIIAFPDSSVWKMPARKCFRCHLSRSAALFSTDSRLNNRSIQLQVARNAYNSYFKTSFRKIKVIHLSNRL